MDYTAAAALLDGSFMTHFEHLCLASSFAVEDLWDESLWAHIDCIKNILRDGSPTAPLPLAPGSPDNIPREILGAAFNRKRRIIQDNRISRIIQDDTGEGTYNIQDKGNHTRSVTVVRDQESFDFKFAFGSSSH